MNAYITDIASFLPNAPVDNDHLEQVLGVLGAEPSRNRAKVLKHNKIAQRHYAIDPATGAFTHNNAQLTAEAIRRLRPYEGFRTSDIRCLCTGTSSPDQMTPGHGLMVHGELASAPAEVMSAAGICLSGVVALKYAAMSVASGNSHNAVATGSERASAYLRAQFLRGQRVREKGGSDLDGEPVLAFEAEFLRWMLSDGAGAMFVAPSAAPDRLSLRIDWIEPTSFAHELPTCMYAGGVIGADGRLRSWLDFDTLEEAAAQGALAFKQDTKLLGANIVEVSVCRTLPAFIDKHRLQPDQIDWFIGHYSSDFFRQPLADGLARIGFAIPFERWFSNLSTVGNVGSASIYLHLAELFHSGRLAAGQRILCFIPESGRFSSGFMHLTVAGPT